MKANNIFVLSREKAMKFEPATDRMTYVIRIFDKKSTYFPLNCSMDNIVWIDEFNFDLLDNEGGNKRADIRCALSSGMTLFRTRDARELIGNFAKHFKDGMDVMAHCRYGVNRSAGAVISLNDLYDLGHDYLIRQFDQYDQHVYWTMMRTAYYAKLVNEEKRAQIAEALFGN